MNRHGKTTKTERDLNVSYFVKVKLRVVTADKAPWTGG